MKFVKQQHSLKLGKIELARCKPVYRHGPLLPDTVRCIISGPSNCGKTNLVIGLLLHENGLKFENLYIYSKTLFQPKYLFLEKVLQLVPNINYMKFCANEEVISLHEADSNSVVLFDDIACENQNNVREFFAMGRHKNIDCFYLNQTYSKIPKQLIRDNANLIIVFKQDDVNLRHIYDEHVGADMTWAQFRDLCSKIWSEPYSYLVINKDCEKNKGCYRMKFDTYIIID